MSRLTEDLMNSAPWANTEERAEWWRNKCYEVFEELERYRHLEEQGRLVELPCKVGDTVWAIFPTWTPMECEVVAIEILTSTVNIETKVVDTDADRIFWPADFGNTVFLTKEEAEAKLRELNTHDREKSVGELAELGGKA